MESQHPRLVWVEKDLQTHLVPPFTIPGRSVFPSFPYKEDFHDGDNWDVPLDTSRNPWESRTEIWVWDTKPRPPSRPPWVTTVTIGETPAWILG